LPIVKEAALRGLAADGWVLGGASSCWRKQAYCGFSSTDGLALRTTTTGCGCGCGFAGSWGRLGAIVGDGDGGGGNSVLATVSTSTGIATATAAAAGSGCSCCCCGDCGKIIPLPKLG